MKMFTSFGVGVRRLGWKHSGHGAHTSMILRTDAAFA